jgi:TadE-like protein
MLMSALPKRLLRPVIRSIRRAPTKQSEHGASAVEFAIIVSLLFLIVFGIIQFGIAFNRDQGIQAAAREGARIAAVGGTQKAVASRVRDAQSLFDPNDVKITIDYSDNDGASYPGTNKICDDLGSQKCTDDVTPPCAGKIGDLVRVTATVPASSGNYAIVIPFWGNVNITYSSKGVFRCEQS